MKWVGCIPVGKSSAIGSSGQSSGVCGFSLSTESHLTTSSLSVMLDTSISIIRYTIAHT